MHNCFFAPLTVVSVIQLTLPVDLPEPLLVPLPDLPLEYGAAR